MNPNSMCVVENEVLRARLKRNKELAIEVLHIVRAPGRMDGDDIKSIIERLGEIITGK